MHPVSVLRNPVDPFRMRLKELQLPDQKGDDRAVQTLGTHLKDKEIAFVVGGGIAAYKAPELVRMLRRYGANVSVYLTAEAIRLVSAESLRWAVGSSGNVFDHSLTGNVEHLTSKSGRRYDAHVVSPATYNLINKVAQGIADDPVTTLLATALGRLEKARVPLLIVPTMNGDMATTAVFRSLESLEASGAYLIQPRTENGKWELPDINTITLSLCRQLSMSPVAQKPILLTAGPTPVRVDRVRVMTNIFRGALGEKIAHELIVRGALLRFLFGGDMGRLPTHVKAFTTHYRDFDGYLAAVQRAVGEGYAENTPFAAGIFSAAVADYRPEQIFDGKIASGEGEGITLPPFVPTPKIIDGVRKLSPSLPMITFKLMANVTEEALLQEARHRLEKYQVVVANRLEDLSNDQTAHVAWIVTREGELKYEGTKVGLAQKIVDQLERIVIGG